MPCFNHGRFVTESARSILRQTHSALELIIVDDGSTDDSRAQIQRLAAQDPRVHPVLHPRNLGASRSRNDGLDLATGDVVCFCDADDLWMPAKLAHQLAALERAPQCGVVYSDAMIVDQGGMATGQRFSDLFPVPAQPSGDLFEELCLRNFINIQTVMMRRRCLDGIRFDERIKWVEDWWFWISVARRHAFLYLAEPLARYRVHGGSTSVTQARGNTRNRFKVLRRVLRTEVRQNRALESQVLYHLAYSLRPNRPRTARRVFRQAAVLAAARWQSWPHCVRPLARLIWRAS